MASLPMFGCIVPGRLAEFEYQKVSETQVVFVIPQCESINHVVIFLTGSQAIPPGYAASIYLCWPKPSPAWHLLGFVCNDKPSAIFKIAKPKTTGLESMFSGAQMVTCDVTAQIGLSIEPVLEVQSKASSVENEISNVSSFVEFTQKMMTSAFNFCSSFAIQQSQMTPQPGEVFVPINALQKWYETFQRKLTLDPNFWKNI